MRPSVMTAEWHVRAGVPGLPASTLLHWKVPSRGMAAAQGALHEVCKDEALTTTKMHLWPDRDRKARSGWVTSPCKSVLSNFFRLRIKPPLISVVSSEC